MLTLEDSERGASGSSLYYSCNFCVRVWNCQKLKSLRSYLCSAQAPSGWGAVCVCGGGGHQHQCLKLPRIPSPPLLILSHPTSSRPGGQGLSLFRAQRPGDTPFLPTILLLPLSAHMASLRVFTEVAPGSGLLPPPLGNSTRTPSPAASLSWASWALMAPRGFSSWSLSATPTGAYRFNSLLCAGPMAKPGPG